MINYGSFIYVKIIKVKKDFTDKTLTVSISDITPMNADSNVYLINTSGSDTMVTWYGYLSERLTSGVYAFIA